MAFFDEKILCTFTILFFVLYMFPEICKLLYVEPRGEHILASLKNGLFRYPSLFPWHHYSCVHISLPIRGRQGEKEKAPFPRSSTHCNALILKFLSPETGGRVWSLPPRSAHPLCPASRKGLQDVPCVWMWQSRNVLHSRRLPRGDKATPLRPPYSMRNKNKVSIHVFKALCVW